VPSIIIGCSGGSSAAEYHLHHSLETGKHSKEAVVIGESQLIKVNWNSD